MAAATRALDAVAELHELALDDRHLPFAGEGVTRSGHPLPRRDARGLSQRGRDPRRVARRAGARRRQGRSPARWRVSRVHVRPHGDDARRRRGSSATGRTSPRSSARSSAPRRSAAGVTAVGGPPPGGAAVAARARRAGTVSRSSSRRSARRSSAFATTRRRGRDRDGGASRRRARRRRRAFAGSQAAVAHAWLPDDGPGLFAPGATRPDDVAGFGVADPTAMLLDRLADARRGPRSAARRRARSSVPSDAAPRRALARHALVHRRSDRAAPASRAPTSSTSTRWREAVTRMLGSDAILRALEPRASTSLRDSGRRDPPDLRRDRAGHVRAACARPPRAGRRAHGRGLRARVGKVGVAIATSGPGATNLVTPIADAWMDSTPLVCITGQVRSSLIGTDAFQEIDATGITMPIVKHSWLVQDVEELPRVLKAAFHVARTGRQGPVLVDVAKDVQEAEFDFDVPRRRRPARLEAAAQGAPAAGPRGCAGDRRGRAPDRLRGRRRAQRRRVRGAARARRRGAACRQS